MASVTSHSHLPAVRPASRDCPRLSGNIFLAYVGLFGLALLEHKMFLAIDDPLYIFMAWFIPVACVGVLAAHAWHFRRCVRQARKGLLRDAIRHGRSSE